MGSDVSRVRFDALRDHAGVLMQQGRVLLDADWNELVAIIVRRLRADAVDLGSTGLRPGIAGVAVVPRTTPDAFRIEADAGDLTIGLGRMYVDGLVAENHGDPADGFDPLLDGRVGTAPLAYDEQPYWPTVAATPLPTDGAHLVYLDVWEREVTPLEAPDLVEQAVGVDTTTRTQVVWQVRVLENDGTTISCATPDEDIPGWAELIAPSAGRLTTSTIPVDEDDDPCALPPTGGYRGPENQTYRVQVHTPGPAGTATFTWSRDNGSIASRVVEVVSATRLRPASLGRDGVLRFRTGDWVEVTDDHREFDQTAGVLRRIEVHDEDGTISFDDDLPADLQMPADDAAARNLRVRRWDQAGEVLLADGTVHEDLDLAGATGAITVPAGGEAVVLEHGVTVRLMAPGGDFRTGDHWIFVARTADTSVEELVEEPPLGTHHHYARLAVVDLPDGETDCRIHWPPEPGTGEPAESCGDCSVCVTPVSHATGVLTIQMAVDEVRTEGGTVCLARGRYDLDEPVDLAGARSVRIRGQGHRTLLTASTTAFTIDRAIEVTIEDLAVVGGAAAPLVVAQSTAGTTLQRLALVNAAGLAGLLTGEDPEDDPGGAGGFAGVDGALAGSRPALAAAGIAAPAVALRGVALRPQIRDNVLVAPVGIGGGGRMAELRADPLGGSLLAVGLDVHANVVLAEALGMWLSGAVAFLGANVVRDNTIIRGLVAGIAAGGAVAPGARVVVEGNALHVSGAGVVVGPGGVTVRGNSIDGPGEPDGSGTGIGILVATTLPVSPSGPLRVLDNDVREVAGAGIEVRIPVDHLDVRGNHVRNAATGIRMVDAARATTATVAHNVVMEVGARDGDEAASGAVGIQLQAALLATVDGNQVVGTGTIREASAGATGIRLVGVGEAVVTGNTVAGVGVRDDPPAGYGIHVGSVYERARVTGNSVRRLSDLDEDGADDGGTFTGVLVGLPLDRSSGAVPEWVEAATEGERAWVITSHTAYRLAVRASEAVLDANLVGGSMNAAAARVAASGDLTVTGNQFRQPRETHEPSLHGRAATASVTGNRATGGEPSIVLDVDPERVAVVANLVNTNIEVGGNPLGGPWDVLNPGGI